MTKPQIVYLVGMPGCGKSYWSRQLANSLHASATDLDEYISQAKGQSISDIFAQDGEQHFRYLESQYLRQISELAPHGALHIVATGGGTPCFHQNMHYMLKQGLVIYLEAPTDWLLHNLKLSDIVRPLIANKVPQEQLPALNALLASRKDYYDQAQVKVAAMRAELATFVEIFKQYKILF